jgi:hypothetical protein
MHTNEQRISILWLIPVLVLPILLLGFSISLVAAAEEYPAGDPRINQYHHFGGDALYCVDKNKVATNDFATMLDDGGFRLLDATGNVELWFVPDEVIEAAIEQAKQTGGGVFVAAGNGSYGPVSLWTYVLDKVVHFVFTGYDEHGKPNSMDFTECTPLFPGVDEHPSGSGLCNLEFEQLIPPKLYSPLYQLPESIPCGECEEYRGELIGDTCFIDLK